MNDISNAEDKLQILVKRNIYLAIFSVLFICVNIFCFLYAKKIENKKELEMVQLTQRKKEVEDELVKLNYKILQINKYMDSWNKNIKKEQKIVVDINKDYLEKRLRYIAERQNIYNINLTLGLPKIIKTVDNNPNVSVLTNKMVVEFKCMTELNAYYLIADFRNYFNGFFIIEGIEFDKIDQIDKDFIKKMKNGEFRPLLSVKIKFNLYYLRS